MRTVLFVSVRGSVCSQITKEAKTIRCHGSFEICESMRRYECQVESAKDNEDRANELVKGRNEAKKLYTMEIIIILY